jgi:hypothetical protein
MRPEMGTEAEAGAEAAGGTETGREVQAETESCIPCPAPLARTVGHIRDSSHSDHERSGPAGD